MVCLWASLVSVAPFLAPLAKSFSWSRFSGNLTLHDYLYALQPSTYPTIWECILPDAHFSLPA